MQRASAVSAWGAVFVALAFMALIFSQSGPVGAQTDPLAGETAKIRATTIGPISVADCTVTSAATVVVEDADGTRATFTNRQNGNVTITADANGITIEAAVAGEDIEGENVTGGNPQTFDAGNGTVVSSTGITCGDDDTGTNENNRADTDTPSEDQYESNDVIRKTVPDKPLPKTGGTSLILGAGVLLAVAAILSIRVLRP